MSTPPPPSPGPSQAHSPPPSQPSPPSPEKEHATENSLITPVQPKAADPSHHLQQQQAQHGFQFQPRPQLAQLVQPQPRQAQASSPLARPGQFPNLTQGQEPGWSPTSPPTSQHGAMYIPQPWSQQYFPSIPPHHPPPPHGPPHYPPHFAPQHNLSPTSAHPSQGSPVQSSPLQQQWLGQQPMYPTPSYAPYPGLPAGAPPAHGPSQAWPASDTRTQVESVRSSYPAAPGLSQKAAQQAGSPGNGDASGVKRKAGGAPLEAQFSHPSFTPINPGGVSQLPPQPAPAKKPKTEKAARNEYYNVPTLSNTTPFITKLKFIVNNPGEFGEAVRWDASGTRVLVKQTGDSLASVFLPRLFGHSKPDNFYRQFSSYGFARVQNSLMAEVVPPGESAADWKAWSHSNFTKVSSADQLASLSPKSYPAKTSKADKAPATPAPTAPPSLRMPAPVPQPALPARGSHPTDLPVFLQDPTPTVLPLAPGTYAPIRTPVVAATVASASGPPPSSPAGSSASAERRTVAELAALRGMSAEARAAVQAGSGGLEEQEEQEEAQGGDGQRDEAARVHVEQDGMAKVGWGQDGGLFGAGEGPVSWGARLASDDWDGQARENA